MKHLLCIFQSMIVVFMFIGNELSAQTNKNEQGEVLKLMTYNLKFASTTYKPSWEVRREMQIDLIKKYNPDIIGTQEGLKEQIDYLAEQLTEYVVVGEGRQGGDDDEHMAIFYKRDKFRLRELQSFALSNTPEVLGSGPEVNPRMVTWARLALINISNEGKAGKYPEDYRGHWENTQEIYVFNTHYFNGRKDSLARLNASKLVLNEINKLTRFGSWTAEQPLFLMGDFNCRPSSAPYRVLVGDKGTANPDLLKNPYEDPKEIDWVLYKGGVKVLTYEEVDYNVDGVRPSDHKPIYVEFEISKKSKK